MPSQCCSDERAQAVFGGEPLSSTKGLRQPQLPLKPAATDSQSLGEALQRTCIPETNHKATAEEQLGPAQMSNTSVF